MVKDTEKRHAVEPGQGQASAKLGRKERAMVDSGILLLKYWLEVSPDEHQRSAQGVEALGHGPGSYSKWDDYSRARDDMFRASDTSWAPWYVAFTDDKRRSRLNIISHLLSQVPYEPLAPRDIVLPKRRKADGHPDPHLQLRYIPTPF